MITVYKAVRLNYIEKDPDSYISLFYHSLPVDLIMKYRIGEWTEGKYPLFVTSNFDLAASFVLTCGLQREALILLCETPEVFIQPKHIPDLWVLKNYPEVAEEFWKSAELESPNKYLPTSKYIPLSLVAYKIRPLEVKPLEVVRYVP